MTRCQNRLELTTGEGITFSYRLASPVTRALAAIIDFLVVAAGVSLLSALVIPFLALAPGVGTALYMLAAFFLSVTYPMVFEYTWRGQTIGKRLLRLRVIDQRGFRLLPSQVVIRNLLRPVDQLPVFYVTGGLCCLFSRYAQRLGDIAGATVVIIENPVKRPTMENILAGKFNSLRQDPLTMAKIRQTITMTEADLGLQALLRRDDVEPDARARLFAELASHFRERLNIPENPLEPVPDEQFIRNVLDVLFNVNDTIRQNLSGGGRKRS
ncbi:MAG: RDD family protein [Lentisphaeria bacterium]|nr:RDD family protein [Lentisphaeria bacterium]